MNKKTSKQTQEKIILTISVRHPSALPKGPINIEKKDSYTKPSALD